MVDPSPVNFLSDPLSEVSRRERRNLLVASVIGILIATMGVVPTRISALGIEFPAPAQHTFVIFSALIVFYFIFGFIIYGMSDFFIWRKKYQDYLVDVETEMQNWSEDDQRHYDELHRHVPKIEWLYTGSKPLAFTRVIFEFGLPILIGLISVCLLLCT